MASLKRRARVSVKAEKHDTNTDGVLELSVTIGYLAADVKKEEMGLLERLMHDYCEAGVVSLERGDLESHLHFQMVCRARVKSGRAFGTLCRKYMDWHGKKNMSPTGKVTCKVLTNRMIHTWKGMIGYFLKDSGKTHFEVAMHNISDEEVIAGKTLHSIYGKADLKSRVVLTNKNIGERAYVWYKYNESRQLTATMLSTLTSMINSAMFIPSSNWIIPVSGQGMDHRRLNSYWKCLVDPTNIDRSDVADVFIRKKEYVKGRYWDEDPPVLPSQHEDVYTFQTSPELVRTSNGDRCLPRALDVPPLSRGSSLHVKQEVVARAVLDKGKRKLFEEVSYVTKAPKAVTFSDPPVDFLPLKDIAPLPQNVFLPTTTALSAVVKKEPQSDGEFWDSVANNHWVSHCAGKTVSSGDLAGNGGSGGASSSRSVAAFQKESPGTAKASVPLVVLLSSDSEEDETHFRKRKAVVMPASVYVDRSGSLESAPFYTKGEDTFGYEMKEPCPRPLCRDPPMQCTNRC